MNYERRRSDTVNIGGIILGGDNPIRLQSMTNTSTMNTEASAAQCESIAQAGADYVRLTAQGEREANNLALIRDMLRSRGCMIPLIADIHFNPKAAFAAARNVDKVRINPGNFIDPGRTFKQLEYTDEEYAAELDRLDKALAPLLDLCASRGVALRIGVNHGSLSDRIMSRYGDTPAGMTESAMEFLRVCRRHGFGNVVLSIKASNVVVMVETVRMLVKAMDKEDMHFPLHLGVTEAGDGEDGRVKSAVGIGTLLAEGLGDTIRVSLSEAPEAELPVARAIVNRIDRMASAPAIDFEEENFEYGPSAELPVLTNGIACATVGAGKTPVVAASGTETAYTDTRWAEERRPDFFIGDTDNIIEISADEILSSKPEIDPNLIVVITSSHPNFPAHIRAARQSLSARGVNTRTIV
ncbi:MAG: (E)-4-hydroxy-3-methylbut-2-enyl-diphosphate synthase [Paramuribaculum sp.]|nr:(E)-4-hydroxy-3-methylbut-2-enyl-diphosphate synthase [Paramuribaculum sp.]